MIIVNGVIGINIFVIPMLTDILSVTIVDFTVSRHLSLLIVAVTMEMKREADSSDITAECCSHDYQPTVIGTGNSLSDFVVFLMFCSLLSKQYNLVPAIAR